MEEAKPKTPRQRAAEVCRAQGKENRAARREAAKLDKLMDVEEVSELRTRARKSPEKTTRDQLEWLIARIEERLMDPSLSATTFSTLSRTHLAALAQRDALDKADGAPTGTEGATEGAQTALSEFERRMSKRAAEREGAAEAV